MNREQRSTNGEQGPTSEAKKNRYGWLRPFRSLFTVHCSPVTVYCAPSHLRRGMTLIDTLVGVALMTLVFVGFFAVFQLSLDVVLNGKARIGAIALANEKMEYLRSLSYDALGTLGGIPSGAIVQTESLQLNGITYTRRVLIQYIDKASDGVGSSDTNHITADMKVAKVSVSWQIRAQARDIRLVSEFAPPGVESTVPGGTLSIAVVDAVSAPLAGATVRIVNTSVSPAIDVSATSNASGEVVFIGAPAASGYQITVSKSGYSSAQTYSAVSPLTNPSPGHLTVQNGQTTAATFAIDQTGALVVETYKKIQTASWTDSFTDTSKLATSTHVTVSGGLASLAAGATAGTMTSENIEPAYLYGWKQVQWSHTAAPGTSVRYHVYRGATIVSESDLPGNSVGFTTSPVNISSLATSTYPLLVLVADFAGNGASYPYVSDWNISYDTGPEPLPNVPYTLVSNKTIGTTSTGQPVYKYNESGSSGASARVTIPALEWGVYTLTIPLSSGYDLTESCVPQPSTINPGETVTNRLYLDTHTANSLLVSVRTGSGVPIPGATVLLSRSTFSVSNTTASCGQVHFPGLSEGTVAVGNPYAISVSAPGYQTYTASSVDVSGASRLSVILSTQ